MSWKDHERLVRELGIPIASPEDVRAAGIYGTTFFPSGIRIVFTTDDDDDEKSVKERVREMRARIAQLPERGEECARCPFVEDDECFGYGNQVKITTSTLDHLLARRFDKDPYLDGIAHLLYDRRHYKPEELDAGIHGLVTNPPFSNRSSLPRLKRVGPVSIRRRWNGSIVISRRGHAGQPIDAARGDHGVMRVHCGDPRPDQDEVMEFDCTCLATDPFPRWLIEKERAVEMFETALRRTDEIVELGVRGESSGLTHVTWLMGAARGQARALWPTNPPAVTQRVCKGITINMLDTCVAEEVRRELRRINREFGIDVPGRHHGDLDPASAWELLRAVQKSN